jgi:hypothetical protein
LTHSVPAFGAPLHGSADLIAEQAGRVCLTGKPGDNRGDIFKTSEKSGQVNVVSALRGCQGLHRKGRD